jgi:hypothetical protein
MEMVNGGYVTRKPHLFVVELRVIEAGIYGGFFLSKGACRVWEGLCYDKTEALRLACRAPFERVVSVTY